MIESSSMININVLARNIYDAAIYLYLILPVSTEQSNLSLSNLLWTHRHVMDLHCCNTTKSDSYLIDMATSLTEKSILILLYTWGNTEIQSTLTSQTGSQKYLAMVYSY